MPDIIYNAEPTPNRFHQSKALVRGIRGPRRGGKTTCCCAELMKRGNEQAVGLEGLRNTRFAVIRSTYRELEDTTLATWLNWFPEKYYGKFSYHTMTHHIREGELNMEVLFRSLDKPKDIGKVLSLELTAAYINEAKEIYSRYLIDGLLDAIGQYPAKKDGGCTWHGLIMDTNSCDTNHWWYEIAEKERPSNWEFFSQPGAMLEVEGEFVMNPGAENLCNLNEGADYYLSRAPGHEKDYVRVYFCNNYGFVKEGTAVHSAYVDAVHCAKENIYPVSGLPIVVGLDFGLTPAAAFLQKQASGQWIVFDELVTEHLADKQGILAFGERELAPALEGLYQGFDFEIWGDPAGAHEAQTDESTCFQILNKLGIKAKPTFTNDPTIRRESLDAPLNRMIDGKPGLIISPKCVILREALLGGYHYKVTKTSSGEKYESKPVKNQFSHIVESAEYGLVGAGEGKALIHKPIKPKTRPSRRPGRPGGWMR